MMEAQSAQAERERIERTIEIIREDLPQLKNILEAFKGLMAEQAALRAELLVPVTEEPSPDPVKFAQGVPLLSRDAFEVSEEYLRTAANHLIPTMEQGFPRITEQLASIKKAIENRENRPTKKAIWKLLGREDRIKEFASRINVDSKILRFVLIQLIKPFAQIKARSNASLSDDSKWTKGYCPMCGSWPEIGFLEGQEGRRRLRCSFCGHEWSYTRIACPFCECVDPEQLELYYSQTRPFERAELCRQCKKYFVSIDIRGREFQVDREVAALGLVHLDLLAQEKGYSPGAACDWNPMSID
jgi:FdhE protein